MSKKYLLTPYARITFHAFFEGLSEKNEAIFLYNGLTLKFPLAGNAEKQIQNAEKDKPHLLILWFRTKKGLVNQPQLSTILAAPNLKVRKNKKVPIARFEIGGRLIKIKEQTLTFKIEASGNLLKKDFQTETLAEKEIIDKPSNKIKIGRTYIVTGKYDIATNQLHIEKITPKRLETRENPPIPEQTQGKDT